MSQIGGYNIERENLVQWDRLARTVRCTFPIDWVIGSGLLGTCDVILDYGCGNGRTLAILHDLGLTDLWGCDTSEQMCKVAAERVPAARITHIDATLQGVPMGAFDKILMFAVLSSVISCESRVKILLGFRRFLRRNGLVVVGDFCASESPAYRRRYSTLDGEPRILRTAEGLYIHHFALGEIEELLDQAGFRSIESHAVVATTLHGNRLPGQIVVGALS